MVGKKFSGSRQERQLDILVVLVSASVALGPYFFTEAVAGGGGGGRSGISQVCDEAACHVNMTASTFAPDTLKIKPNALVVWTNNDKVAHAVTSGNFADDEMGALFDSGLSTPIIEATAWERKFDSAGTFEYFCQFHPRMVGQVIVTGQPILELQQAAPLAIAAVIASTLAIAAIMVKRNKRRDMA